MTYEGSTACEGALEEQDARRALPLLDQDGLDRIVLAARKFVDAASSGDVGAQLTANRRFHLGLLAFCGGPRELRLVESLWDASEPFRAMYSNSLASRRLSVASHGRILLALSVWGAKTRFRPGVERLVGRAVVGGLILFPARS